MGWLAEWKNSVLAESQTSHVWSNFENCTHNIKADTVSPHKIFIMSMLLGQILARKLCNQGRNILTTRYLYSNNVPFSEGESRSRAKNTSLNDKWSLEIPYNILPLVIVKGINQLLSSSKKKAIWGFSLSLTIFYLPHCNISIQDFKQNFKLES